LPVLTVLALAAGCSGDRPAGAERGQIVIGHLSACEGPLGVFYDATTAGAMLPLIERGARPNGAKGDAGVSGAVVAGRPIEVAWACSDGTPDRALAEARRLVEEERVDILVGPLSGSEGIALAEYALEQAGVTFVSGTSAARDETVKAEAENFFRWGGDGAQWTAGLGNYAYTELGWRTAALIGDKDDSAYTQAAGFVAEFCALGGQVEERLWPALGEENYASFIAQIPDDVDGLFLAVAGTGTPAFVRQYGRSKGNLAREMVASAVAVEPTVLAQLGGRLTGVVAAGPVAADSGDPQFRKYLNAMKKAYPDLPAGGVFDVLYYDATEAVLRSLEQVEGDLANAQEAFRTALRTLQIRSPRATVTLDENRNAITDNFVLQVVEDQTGDGVPDIRTLRVIAEVGQTLGGLFEESTSSPAEDDPGCMKATPPAWATHG
jgi:branched-chain amino acid transport system substrate-binding protein